MSKVIMVTGGSRSGKSVLAEQKAKEHGKRSVLYIATAIPTDEDMKERIRIRNFISTISGNRIVLLATHIVSDVESIARETLFMRHGELIRSGVPAELLQEIDGKVFEVLFPEETEAVFPEEVLVSNLNRTAEGILYRVVSDEVPQQGTVHTVRPTMEDLYLYLMREKD